MNENERPAPGDGQAKHGYQNEVNWDGGKGGQPYANQDADLGPTTADETEAGNRGEASGRNLEEMEAMKGMPDRGEREAPRNTRSGDGE